MHELTRPLTAQEERELESRLWQATAKKAALYTSGRSTSLHEDTVKALLNSIRFSLELYFSEQGFHFTAILSQDLDEILSAADASVARAVKRARFQYDRACRCAFQDESVALQTTLRGIGMFFHRYDHRFFAAACPCKSSGPKRAGGLAGRPLYLRLAGPVADGGCLFAPPADPECPCSIGRHGTAAQGTAGEHL